MVFVTRLIAISVLALSDPWFLFPFWAACGMPAPHGAAVHGVGVTVRVTVGEDGFLVMISRQGLPNTMCIKIGRRCAKRGGHNLTPTGGYKRQKERQVPRCVGRVQNPQLFQLGHFLGREQFQIPWKARKIGSVAWKGPIVWNGTSCRVAESTSGPVWLRGITRSGNNSESKCMPSEWEGSPQWSISFLWAPSWAQTIASSPPCCWLPWRRRGLRVHGVSLGRIIGVLVVRSIRNTIWRVCGKGHMPAIVSYEHHVRSAL